MADPLDTWLDRCAGSARRDALRARILVDVLQAYGLPPDLRDRLKEIPVQRRRHHRAIERVELRRCRPMVDGLTQNQTAVVARGPREIEEAWLHAVRARQPEVREVLRMLACERERQAQLDIALLRWLQDRQG